MPRGRRQFPDVISGYELRNFRVWVVQAAAAINLVANPSLERGTTGYAAAGGAAIAQSADWQSHGAYSLKVTPGAGLNDGAYYASVSLTAGSRYAFAVDGKFPAGIAYQLYFANTLGQRQSPVARFTGTGRRQRLAITWPALASGAYRLYVTKVDSASVAPFYLDGWQCEVGAPSTYIDGDQRGLLRRQVAYYWNGAEHASTSTRVQATRAGGTEVDLAKYGFRLLAVLGLGLTGFSNLFTPNAFAGGAQFERTVMQEHTFTLAGALTGRGMGALQQARAGLEALLRPNAAIRQQPLVLKLQECDDDGNPVGEKIEIPCTFEDGLAGQLDNDFQERLGLTFKIYLPFTARSDAEAGAALGYQAGFTAAYAAKRINGVWSGVGTGFDGQVNDVAVDAARGRIYFGGIFNAAGGATHFRVCYWDVALQTFVAMDGGVNGNVYKLAIDPSGNVYVGGSFSACGSGADVCKGLARWNVATNTWTAFNPASGTVNAGIFSMAMSPTGVLYFGGAFTDYGDAAGDYICSYDGASFVSLGTSPFSATYQPRGTNGLAVNPGDGLLYAGGWVIGGGSAAVSLHKWTGSAWVTVLSTEADFNRRISAIAWAPSNLMYIGGDFATLGGVAVANVASYTGTGVLPLGVGVNAGVFSVLVKVDGTILFGGSFTKAGGLSLNDRIAAWTGSSWVPLDIDGPASSYMSAGVEYLDVLYLGLTDTGNAVSASVTTLTNTGSADAYPVFTLTGPGTINQIKNYTTGDVLYFNLTLNAGEIAVLDLTPSQIRFYSNFRSNLMNTILPGSSLATFRLTPGANSISVFIAGTVNANTAVVARWRPSYLSVDDALYR